MKKEPEPHGYGGRFGDAAGWVREAKRHVLELADTELGFVHSELEARLSDTGVRLDGQTKRLKFDPHILTEAVRDLTQIGALEVRQHSSYGGKTHDVLVTGRSRLRETAISKAVRRKGMLNARYLALAETAGEAGELVVRKSLQESSRTNTPIERDFAEVGTLLGERLHGSLDSGAYVMVTDPTTGIPTVIVVPIEVKNRRLVLYPIHKEVHQLLKKAAQAQNAQPSVKMMPVLVCRRAHSWLFWMARDLGFRVHQTNQQYIHLPKNLDSRKFDEVRNELGLSDLRMVPHGSTAGVPLIRKFFNETVQGGGLGAAARWVVAAPVVEPYSEVLRKDDLSSVERRDLVRELRQELEAAYDLAGFTDPLRSWSAPDLE